MKRKLYLSAIIAFLFCGVTQAVNYFIVNNSPDGLSGEIQIPRSVFADNGQTRVWEFILPDGPIRITRVNSAHLPYGGQLLVNTANPILNSVAIGESTTIIDGSNELHFVLNAGHPTLFASDAVTDPVIVIRFAKISNNNSSKTVIFGGDVELSDGILRASGHTMFGNQRTTAIMGNHFASFTTFGGINGGRIRGSNEGYLILEGNPNGFGAPRVYINRFVANGHVIMTGASGRVGLGIDHPLEKLHIGGFVRGNAAGGALGIRTQHGSLEIGPRDNTGTHFITNRPKFIFNRGMEVQGDILATEVRIKSIENFPDYVFYDCYQLRPLSEVHSFIQTYGHLPDIPSAAEVRKNGIGLVEMQLMLLKKIEELTLYAIEQQQRIEELERIMSIRIAAK